MFFADKRYAIYTRRQHDAQRAGIADGWEFEIRPPELLPGFLIKLNIKN